jgi:hypothetical protein
VCAPETRPRFYITGEVSVGNESVCLLNNFDEASLIRVSKNAIGTDT